MSTSVSPAVSTLPALDLQTGRWTLDPSHSSVLFSIRHLGLAKVRGRFDVVSAGMDLGPSLAASQIAATIDLASINTSNADRDAHLRSTDFFDTATHPTMQFVSTAIEETGDGFTLVGNLTLNDVTRPVTLAVEFNGSELGPTGKRHAGFGATGAIRRSEFGIEFGLTAIGADRLALGDEVKLELDLEFIAPDGE